MRRKKAARKCGPSKPLSAHEAGKTAPRGKENSAPATRSIEYDNEASYKPAEPLTVREEEMLSFVADDQPNEEIAKRGKIARSTVDKHTWKTFSKKSP
jgi:DNA-binding NarL/FixJ family response regulator